MFTYHRRKPNTHVNHLAQKSAEKTIPIADAWALVAMADRINGGRYIKFIEYRQDDTGSHTDEIAFRPNRDLILNSLMSGAPAVTDADRAHGRVLAEHFQGLALAALGGNIGDFDRSVFAIVQKDEVGTGRDLAFIACLGARYHREVAREAVEQRLDQIGFGSVFQGSIGENLTRKVRVLAKFAARSFEGSVVRATDGNNLYFWTSSKPVGFWSEEELVVRGAVKAHSTDQKGYRETRLTRVKIAS